MNEVLKKIDELQALLESKISDNEKIYNKLVVNKKELEELELKAVAKQNNLSAMERIYKKYVDFDNEKITFTKEKADYNSIIKNLTEDQKQCELRSKKLDKREADLDTRKKAISKQALSMKEREADFDKKREELKGLISGQAIKDIFK